MKWLKRNWYILLIAILLSIGGVWMYSWWTGQPKVAQQASVPPETAQAVQSVEPPATVASLLTAVNAERAKVGAPALVIDERLNQSAQTKADDMRARDYRAHVDPDGKRGVDIAHEYAPDICVAHVGENLQWNIIEHGTPPTTTPISWWKSSPKHYAAMIDTGYMYTGFGINGDVIVEHFCRP